MKAVGPRWPPSERSAWRHLVELLVSRVELLMCFNGPTWRNESGVKPVQLQTIYSEYSCIWSLTTHIQMLIPTNVFIKTSKQMNILRNKREIQINNLDSIWIKWIKKKLQGYDPNLYFKFEGHYMKMKSQIIKLYRIQLKSNGHKHTNKHTNKHKQTDGNAPVASPAGLWLAATGRFGQHPLMTSQVGVSSMCDGQVSSVGCSPLGASTGQSQPSWWQSGDI